MLIKLESLPYFRISHLEALLPGLKKPSLYQKVSRWIERGDIIELKKGFYVSREYKEKHGSDRDYLFYLANVLRFPSYVSGVSILQQYNILTELTYPVTSTTPKSTRTYSNNLGEFTYHSISPKLYLGYTIHAYEGSSVYVASVAKALFDYLYIKYGKKKVEAGSVIEKERLNLDLLKKQDASEFEKYANLSGNNFFGEIASTLLLHL